MELKRHKNYKATSPQSTINQIRNILYSKLGILLKEIHYNDENSLFYSCRIIIANENLERFNIGVNGKGMSLEYALASAYGEFMERLQNGLMFMHTYFARKSFIEERKNDFPFFYEMIKKLGIHLDYHVFPDEKYTSGKRENEMVVRRYVRGSKIEEFISSAGDERLTLLPYYSLGKKKVEHLPIEFITHNCTSNGMCAGNTDKEALIQGIGEVLERYVVRKAYQDNLSFPTVAKRHFVGNEIYEKIILLEKETGWKLDIKDCSCGVNIPAIGLLIKDEKNHQYQFRVGVDPSPITALERCITEIYQGRTNVNFKEINIPYQTALLYDKSIKEKEALKTFYNSTGHFPISILSDDFSYKFDEFDLGYGLSDDSDFIKLTELITSLGYEVFIRDVSFLGFPSFHVYVPGMSEIKNVFSNKQLSKNFKQTKDYFLIAHNLQKATESQIFSLLDYLNTEEKNNNIIDFLNDKDALINLNPDLIYTALYTKVGMFKEAYEKIKLVIPTIKESSSLLFYKCMRDVLYYKFNNYNDKYLLSFYGKELLDEMYKLIDSKQLLNQFNMSSCFECDKCKISNSCNFLGLMKIAKKTEVAFGSNIPNQEAVSRLFFAKNSISI